MCLLVQYWHRETKKACFTHSYQHRTIRYIPAIALINKTNQNIISFCRVTAINFSFDKRVHMSVNEGLPEALAIPDQVLNLILFGDLLYFVTGNDKDKQEFCNMRFD